MKLLILFSLYMTLAISANAAQIKVCVITTDVDAERTDFFLETNARGELDSIRLYKTLGQKVVDDESFPVERAIDEGFVAAEREGRAIVMVKTSNFTAVNGGVFSLNILQNAIKNTRIKYTLKLSKIGGKFVITGPGGQQVNRLHLIGNKIPVVGLVGIKEVQASYSR